MDENEVMLMNIKDNCQGWDKAQKVAVIQTLPKTWSASEIEDKTGLNRKLVGQVRSGEVSLEEKKREPRLPEETRNRVREFFLDPVNVRISPRANDTISVKNQDGIREKRPRHLLNFTLHEAHEKYLQENPNHPISRAQFCRETPGLCW